MAEADESKKTPQGFEGWKEQDLIAIYNLGKAEKVSAGDCLIREGDLDQTVFLITEGRLSIEKQIKGISRTIAVLGPGDWVGEIAFTKKTPRTASVVAVEPARVLRLDENTLDHLEPRLQLAVIKTLNQLASQRIDEIVHKQADLTGQNESLVSFIRENLDNEREYYAQSELILSIIDGIPRLPVYAGKLITRLNDINVKTKEVVELVKEDPALAAEIMKTVNSAYYNFRNKISSLQHAVMLLGFNQVYQLVLYNATRRTMPETRQFRDLQLHCIAVSMFASEVASLVDPRRSAVAGTLGMLHEVGKIVILLLKHKRPKLSMFFDMLDYTKLGSMLLTRWNLPEDVCKSVEFQAFYHFAPPQLIPDRYRMNVVILAIAHLFVDYLRTSEREVSKTAFLEEYLRVSGLRERSIETLAREKLLPALHEKKDVLPVVIRSFLKQSRNARDWDWEKSSDAP